LTTDIAVETIYLFEIGLAAAMLFSKTLTTIWFYFDGQIFVRFYNYIAWVFGTTSTKRLALLLFRSGLIAGYSSQLTGSTTLQHRLHLFLLGITDAHASLITFKWCREDVDLADIKNWYPRYKDTIIKRVTMADTTPIIHGWVETFRRENYWPNYTSSVTTLLVFTREHTSFLTFTP